LKTKSLLMTALLMTLAGVGSQASTHLCGPKFEKSPRVEAVDITDLPNRSGTFDSYHDFNYSGRSRVLFLSDGASSLKLGADSKTFFVTTDIERYRGINVQADNNNLPFQRGAFELIIMNRGLCPCRSETMTCGGLKLEASQLRSFLTQVTEALDEKKQSSMALLTGFAFPGRNAEKVPDLFISVLEELMDQYPQFDFRILSDTNKKTKYGFVGIAISIKNQPIGENIVRLVL
jgi:hypothetical protein